MVLLRLSQEMAENNQQGSIVTLLCDAGNRYAHLYDDDWVEKNFGQGLQERIQKILSGI
jgi:cysteine synthase A